MDKKQMRRKCLSGHLATAGVVVVLLFQAVFLSGVLEVQAETVSRYAPWAYEYFLRITGEHPDAAPKAAVVEEVKPPAPSVPEVDSALAQAAGIKAVEEKPPVDPVPAADAETEKFVENVTAAVPAEESGKEAEATVPETISPEPPAEEKTVEESLIEEKTVEELLEEELQNTPEIPEEPRVPGIETNTVPETVDDEEPKG